MAENFLNFSLRKYFTIFQYSLFRTQRLNSKAQQNSHQIRTRTIALSDRVRKNDEENQTGSCWPLKNEGNKEISELAPLWTGCFTA